MEVVRIPSRIVVRVLAGACILTGLIIVILVAAGGILWAIEAVGGAKLLAALLGTMFVAYTLHTAYIIGRQAIDGD